MGNEAVPPQLEPELQQKQGTKVSLGKAGGSKSDECGEEEERRVGEQRFKRQHQKHPKKTKHPNTHTHIMQQILSITQSKAPVLTTTTVTAHQHVDTGSRIPRMPRARQ